MQMASIFFIQSCIYEHIPIDNSISFRLVYHNMQFECLLGILWGPFRTYRLFPFDAAKTCELVGVKGSVRTKNRPFGCWYCDEGK